MSRVYSLSAVFMYIIIEYLTRKLLKFIALISLGFLWFSGADQLAVVPEQSGLRRLGSDINMKGYLDDKIGNFWEDFLGLLYINFTFFHVLNLSITVQSNYKVSVLYVLFQRRGRWTAVLLLKINLSLFHQTKQVLLIFIPTTMHKG